MGGGETIELSYEPKDPGMSEDELRGQLESSRLHEIHRGLTTVGPHRDDFRIEVGGMKARLFASQGQQRTAMLSIKLGSMELERGERGSPPLLLLDDILSDLDEGRRARLMDWVLERAGQTLLTCTEPAAAGPGILSQARILSVSQGKVTEEQEECRGAAS